MRRATTVAVVLLVAMIGVGSALATQPMGKVIGRAYGGGGPPRLNTGPRPTGGITVVLVDKNGQQVAYATSSADGGFVLSARPGRYTIVGYIVYIGGRGRRRCGETKSVLVRADKHTKASVHCSLK
jgi:hypothetical protein